LSAKIINNGFMHLDNPSCVQSELADKYQIMLKGNKSLPTTPNSKLRGCSLTENTSTPGGINLTDEQEAC
jgi:hypothetical protein